MVSRGKKEKDIPRAQMTVHCLWALVMVGTTFVEVAYTLSVI